MDREPIGTDRLAPPGDRRTANQCDRLRSAAIGSGSKLNAVANMVVEFHLQLVEMPIPHLIRPP
jgi:hypothetical protein